MGVEDQSAGCAGRGANHSPAFVAGGGGGGAAAARPAAGRALAALAPVLRRRALAGAGLLVERLKIVLYSNDCAGRQLTLRVLGELAPLSAESTEVVWQVLARLGSVHAGEQREAARAAERLCRCSREAAEHALPRLLGLLGGLRSADREARAAAARALASMGHSWDLALQAQLGGEALLTGGGLEAGLADEVLRALTMLGVRCPATLRRQAALLWGRMVGHCRVGLLCVERLLPAAARLAPDLVPGLVAAAVDVFRAPAARLPERLAAARVARAALRAGDLPPAAAMPALDMGRQLLASCDGPAERLLGAQLVFGLASHAGPSAVLQAAAALLDVEVRRARPPRDVAGLPLAEALALADELGVPHGHTGRGAGGRGRLAREVRATWRGLAGLLKARPEHHRLVFGLCRRTLTGLVAGLGGENAGAPPAADEGGEEAPRLEAARVLCRALAGVLGDGAVELGAESEMQLVGLALQVSRASPALVPDILPALLARSFTPGSEGARATAVAEAGARGAAAGEGSGRAYWRYKTVQAAMTHGAHALVHPWAGRLAKAGSVEDDRVWWWLQAVGHVCASEVALQGSAGGLRPGGTASTPGGGPAKGGGAPSQHLLSAAKCLGAACDARTGFGFQRRWVAVRAMEQDAVRAMQALLEKMDQGVDPGEAPGVGRGGWAAARDFWSAAESWEHLLRGSFGMSRHSVQSISLSVARCRLLSHAAGAALRCYGFEADGRQYAPRVSSREEVLHSLAAFAEVPGRPASIPACRSFQEVCRATLDELCRLRAGPDAVAVGAGDGHPKATAAAALRACLRATHASASSPVPAQFFCMRPAARMALDPAAAGPLLEFRRGCGLSALTFAVSGVLAHLPPRDSGGGRSPPQALLLAAELVSCGDPDLARVGADHPLPGAHLPPRGGAQPAGASCGGAQRIQLFGPECGFSGECTADVSDLAPGAYALVAVATLECQDGSQWDLPVGRVPELTVQIS